MLEVVLVCGLVEVDFCYDKVGVVYLKGGVIVVIFIVSMLGVLIFFIG